MPTAEELAPHLEHAVLLALCWPINPTGTTCSKDGLTEICDLVLAENEDRGTTRKPLADGIDHVHPVSVRAAMKPYTVYIDGISKLVGAWAPRAVQVATAAMLDNTDELGCIPC